MTRGEAYRALVRGTRVGSPFRRLGMWILDHPRFTPADVRRITPRRDQMKQMLVDRCGWDLRVEVLGGTVVYELQLEDDNDKIRSRSDTS